MGSMMIGVSVVELHLESPQVTYQSQAQMEEGWA